MFSNIQRWNDYLVNVRLALRYVSLRMLFRLVNCAEGKPFSLACLSGLLGSCELGPFPIALFAVCCLKLVQICVGFASLAFYLRSEFRFAHSDFADFGSLNPFWASLSASPSFGLQSVPSFRLWLTFRFPQAFAFDWACSVPSLRPLGFASLIGVVRLRLTYHPDLKRVQACWSAWAGMYVR